MDYLPVISDLFTTSQKFKPLSQDLENNQKNIINKYYMYCFEAFVTYKNLLTDYPNKLTTTECMSL